jgi:hypothetical protein
MGVKLSEAYKAGRRIAKATGLPRFEDQSGKSIWLSNLDGSQSWSKAERIKQRNAPWAKMPPMPPADLAFILDDKTNLHFIPMFRPSAVVTVHPSGTSYEYTCTPEIETANKGEILDLLCKECDKLGLVHRRIDGQLFVQVR